MSRAGVLLDRDGTIIVDHGYVGTVDRVEFIPGAVAAIAALNQAGVPVAVVTNQAGVARGLYGIEDVQQVHKHMIAELARHDAHVDQWLFCPYHPDGSVEAFARASRDRKPAPGMALAAADILDLDLERSWVVGNDECDIGLARSVGARAVHVGPAHDLGPEITSVPDLATAVDLVLEELRAPAPRHAAPPRFPTQRYGDAGSYCSDYVDELARAMATVDPAQISRAGEILNAAYDRDAAVFSCGNGGSASIANHLQCDHVKGVRSGTDLRNRVLSLSTNIELFSAISNDLGYEFVFEYQLQSIARPGDVLLAVSSSGRSPNIVRALQWADSHGMETISLTGFEGMPSRQLAAAAVHVDSINYGIIEDAHQACMHLLAQYCRQAHMTADAVASQTF